jgi:hypothetical protein
MLNIAQHLIEARCDVDFHQTKDGETAMQLAQRVGNVAIATLIRNTKQKDAVRVIKDVLLLASPEKIKKQQEDADRAMRELLEQEVKDSASAAAGSQN